MKHTLALLMALIPAGAAGCGGGGGEEDALVDDAPNGEDARDEDPAQEGAPDGQEGDSAQDETGEAADMDSVDEAEEEAPPLGTLGAPCERGDQCEGGFCITAGLLPQFVDGYCTSVMCDPSAPGDCGTQGACLEVGGGFPAVCVRTCGAETDCRDGLACIGLCIPDGFVSNPALPGLLDPADAEVAVILDGIDEGRMRARMDILAGAAPWSSPDGPVTIRSRAVGHPDHAAALDYIETELSAAGLAVERLPFEKEGQSFVNIEARLAGTDPGADPVLITAHLDSTAKSTAGWTEIEDPGPGASDDGTGVVVALELATVLGGLDAGDLPPRGLRFVLFDGEELGLYGSYDYVARLATAGETIGCVMNTDMVGWDPEISPGRFWYQYAPADEAVAAIGLEAIADFSPGAIPIPSPGGLGASSDNYPFWEGGYCASSMSIFPAPALYHTIDDTPGNMDWGFYAVAARSAAAVVAAWAYRWAP